MTVTVFTREATLMAQEMADRNQGPEPPEAIPNRLEILEYIKDLTTELRELADVSRCPRLALHLARAIDEAASEIRKDNV